MSDFYHIPWEVGEKFYLDVTLRVRLLECPRNTNGNPKPQLLQNSEPEHEVCWGFSHTAVEERRPRASLWMGLGVNLTSLVCGNLAEVQAATMARWPGDGGTHEDQVGGNMQSQAGGWSMFQGVKLMPCKNLGTAWGV